MIYTTTSFWALPLSWLAWAIDLYLTMVVARLLLGQLRSDRALRLSQSLAEFTDGPPTRSLGRWLSRRGRPIASWLPWTIVICTGLVVRHALLRLILALA